MADRDGRGRLVPPAADECARVVESFDRAIGATSVNLRGGVAALLALVELLPPLVVRRMRRMSKLPLAERIAYLQALEDSPIGVLTVVLVGLKIPMAIYAFEEGEALRMTGFDRSSTASDQPARRATADEARSSSGEPGGGTES